LNNPLKFIDRTGLSSEYWTSGLGGNDNPNNVVDLQNWVNNQMTQVRRMDSSSRATFNWDSTASTMSVLIEAHGNFYFSVFECKDIEMLNGRVNVSADLLLKHFGSAIDPSFSVNPNRDAAFIAGAIVAAIKAPPLIAKAFKTAPVVVPTVSSAAPIITNNLIKHAETLKRTATVMNNAATRPYIHSTQLIQQIIKSAPSMKDPQTATGLKWVVEGTFNASRGTYELVIDPVTHTILHFLFQSQ
jgi:hypothetical protein